MSGYLCESGLYMWMYVSVSVRHKYRRLFEPAGGVWRQERVTAW